MPFIDPLQSDFPEVIEEYLERGVLKCIAFNHRGNLLAAGCSDGSCIIWDFETRGIAKEFKDKDCLSVITNVCWSKYGHRILVLAADRSLTLWDAFKGERLETEEYVERQDEFDLVPATEKAKYLDINDEEAVDVATLEKNPAFSDSDMSRDEICYLQPDPCPDVPEIEDGLDVNTSKGEISEAESPLSEEAGQNGHITNHESSPLEEGMGGMREKRKRMPSEKFMDFEMENSKKPLKSKP